MNVIVIIALSAHLAQAFSYGTVSAESPYPFARARELAHGMMVTDNPARLNGRRGLWLTGSATRPYSLPELGATVTGAGYTSENWSTSLGWTHFGLEGYREHSLGLTLAWRPFPLLRIGVRGTWYHLDMDIDSHTMNGGDLDLGIEVVPLEWLVLSGRVSNLLSLTRRGGENWIPGEWSVGASVHPFRGSAISWNGSETIYGFINSLEVRLDILRELSIAAGYARETETFTASATLMLPFLAVSYGTSYHTSLGYTHLFSMELSQKRSSVEPLIHGRREKRKSKDPKPNIQKANAEVLGRVRGISPELAERIVIYRESIGPVTEKALVQLGLTEGELRDLRNRITGLEKTKSDWRKKKFQKRKGRRILAADLFNRLVGAGVQPADALKVVRAMPGGDVRVILESYPDAVREEAVRLCGGG